MTIRHLQHKQIDPLKWDGAIFRSRVPQAYALFGYLNKITDDHWSALVYGDYEAVFPLPLKQKFGITYVVQPIFCQQLGHSGRARTYQPWILSTPYPNTLLGYE